MKRLSLRLLDAGMQLLRHVSCKPSHRLRAEALEDDIPSGSIEPYGDEVAPADGDLLAVLVKEDAVLADEQVDVLEQEHRHRAEAENEPHRQRQPSPETDEMGEVGSKTMDEMRADARHPDRHEETGSDEQASRRA